MTSDFILKITLVFLLGSSFSDAQMLSSDDFESYPAGKFADQPRPKNPMGSITMAGYYAIISGGPASIVSIQGTKALVQTNSGVLAYSLKSETGKNVSITEGKVHLLFDYFTQTPTGDELRLFDDTGKTFFSLSGYDSWNTGRWFNVTIPFKIATWARIHVLLNLDSKKLTLFQNAGLCEVHYNTISFNATSFGGFSIVGNAKNPEIACKWDNITIFKGDTVSDSLKINLRALTTLSKVTASAPVPINVPVDKKGDYISPFLWGYDHHNLLDTPHGNSTIYQNTRTACKSMGLGTLMRLGGGGVWDGWDFKQPGANQYAYAIGDTTLTPEDIFDAAFAQAKFLCNDKMVGMFNLRGLHIYADAQHSSRRWTTDFASVKQADLELLNYLNVKRKAKNPNESKVLFWQMGNEAHTGAWCYPFQWCDSGNENSTNKAYYFNSHAYPDYNYARRWVDVAQAIKKTDPAIQLGLDFWYPPYMPDHAFQYYRYVYEELARRSLKPSDYISFADIHWYSSVKTDNLENYYASLSDETYPVIGGFSKNINSARVAITEAATRYGAPEEKTMPIFLSEWGVSGKPERTPTVAVGLAQGEGFLDIMSLNIQMASQYVPGHWDNGSSPGTGTGFFSSENSDVPIRFNLGYYIMKLLAGFKGGQMILSNPSGTPRYMRFYAAKDTAGNLLIAMINFDAESQKPLKIILAGVSGKRKATAWELGNQPGLSVFSEFVNNNAEAYSTGKTLNYTDGIIEYVCPAHSFVMIKSSM